MRLAKVIGNVTLSIQDPAFKGARWLLVSPLEKEQLHSPETATASAIASPVIYDSLGASCDDIVGFVEGGEATRPFDKPTPIDAYNVCIIDQVNYTPPAK